MSLRLIGNPQLDTTNTTSYRIVITIRVAIGVVAVAMATFVYEIIRDHHATAIDILDSTYTALVVFAGINAAQYGLKRFSDAGYAQKKAAARVPDIITTEHPAKPTVIRAKKADEVTVVSGDTEGEE